MTYSEQREACAFLRRLKQTLFLKEAHMTSIADGSVRIQTSSESAPATPSWFGEVVLLTTYLRKHGVLTQISERVRFARRRFGRDAGDRFSRGPVRVRHQWGTHAGGVLRAAPALCGTVHGVV